MIVSPVIIFCVYSIDYLYVCLFLSILAHMFVARFFIICRYSRRHFKKLKCPDASFLIIAKCHLAGVAAMRFKRDMSPFLQLWPRYQIVLLFFFSNAWIVEVECYLLATFGQLYLFLFPTILKLLLQCLNFTFNTFHQLFHYLE